MMKKDWQRMFSNKVRNLMQTKNITPYQLAMTSGVSRGRLSEYLNMKCMPTIFAIINIAYALDVSVNDLMDFDERIEDATRKVW